MTKNLLIGAILVFALVIPLFSQSKNFGKVTGTVSVSGNKSDTVIYLEFADESRYPRSSATAHMDQKNKVFIPRVLPILYGTTVEFRNSDAVSHNIHLIGKGIRERNFMTYPDRPGRVKFPRPVKTFVLCDIHEEMEAFIVVLPTPYFTVADDNGSFSIDNIPEGNYRVKAWHPEKKKEFMREIQVKNGKDTDIGVVLK